MKNILYLPLAVLLAACPAKVDKINKAYRSSGMPQEHRIDREGESTRTTPERSDNLLKIWGPSQVRKDEQHTLVLDGMTNRYLVFGGLDSEIDIDAASVQGFRMYGKEAQPANYSQISGLNLMTEVVGRAREHGLSKLFSSFPNFQEEAAKRVLSSVGPDWLTDDAETVLLHISGFPEMGEKMSPHARYRIPVTFREGATLHAFEFSPKTEIDGGQTIRETDLDVFVVDPQKQNSEQGTGQTSASISQRPFFRVSIGGLSGEFETEQKGPRREINIYDVFRGNDYSLESSSPRIILDNTTKEKAVLGGILAHMNHIKLVQHYTKTSRQAGNESLAVQYNIRRSTLREVDIFDVDQYVLYTGRERETREQLDRKIFGFPANWKPGDRPAFIKIGEGGRSFGVYETNPITGKREMNEEKTQEAVNNAITDFANFVKAISRIDFASLPESEKEDGNLYKFVVEKEYKPYWERELRRHGAYSE